MEILALLLILILPGLLSITYDVVKLILLESAKKIKTSLQSNYSSETETTTQVLSANY
jgi:hypothetical protein